MENLKNNKQEILSLSYNLYYGKKFIYKETTCYRKIYLAKYEGNKRAEIVAEDNQISESELINLIQIINETNSLIRKKRGYFYSLIF